MLWSLFCAEWLLLSPQTTKQWWRALQHARWSRNDLTGCECCQSRSLLAGVGASCSEPELCSTHTGAKKPCDHLHCVPGCAPESSAFF